jgi:hypothetical protein
VSRPRVAALAVALVVGLAPALAGCGTTQAGAAAIVGDHRISVGELQTATTELKQLVRDPAQITQELVLGWLIANGAAVQVATEKGQAVSRDDALRFFSPATFKNGSGGTTPSPAAISAVQTAYALQLLAGQGVDPATAKTNIDQVLADLKAEKVTVNPRYGTFDYAWDAQTQSFTLSPTKVSWITTPPSAGQASPQPTPASS